MELQSISEKSGEHILYKIFKTFKRDDGKLVNYLIHTPILEKLLEKRENWIRTTKHTNLKYSDNDKVSPIKNHYKGLLRIVQKCYMSKILQSVNYIPTTFVIENGILVSNIKQLEKFKMMSEKSCKWYLKEDNGYGGKNIQILKNCKDFTKYIKSNKKYVLQHDVHNPMLYDGRKFDIRIYVIVVYINSKYYYYVHPTSAIRISAFPYDSTSTDINNNLTNCSIHDKFKYNNLITSQSLLTKSESNNYEYMEYIYPEMKKILKDLFYRLEKNNNFKKTNSNMKGYEIMGIDFIVSENIKQKTTKLNSIGQNKKVYLLEINRNIGYSLKDKPEKTILEVHQIFEDFIDSLLEPLVLNKNIDFINKNLKGWEQL